MLDLPNLEPQPIDFPTRPLLLSAFLTMAHQYPFPLAPAHLKDKELFILLNIAETYDSPKLVEAILVALEKVKKHDAWKCFVVGSQRGRVGLARAALRELRVDVKMRICDVEADFDMFKVGMKQTLSN
jgi:hypothetical protein